MVCSGKVLSHTPWIDLYELTTGFLYLTTYDKGERREGVRAVIA